MAGVLTMGMGGFVFAPLSLMGCTVTNTTTGGDAGPSGATTPSDDGAAGEDASSPTDSDSGVDAGAMDDGGAEAGPAPATMVSTADCQAGCAVAGGNVLCWAATPGPTPLPTTAVPALSGVTAVAMGGSNGSNNSGSNPEPRSTFGTGAASCTADVACAISAGALWCWGANVYGSLGNGTTSDSATPVQVMGLTTGVTSVAVAAQNSFACAVAGGNVDCWGSNDKGQLGSGTTAATSAVPVQVTGFADSVISVSAGNTFACALTSGGGVECWGDNTYGQLGNGTMTASTTPVQVTGLTSGVTSLSTGVNYACAVVGGAVQCWGNNGYGTPSMAPAPITGWSSGVTAVSSGQQVVCALVGGGVQCFGENAQGSLGDGTTTNSSTPVQVMGLTSGITSMTAGDASFACAIKADGSLWCWGGQHHVPFAIAGFAQ